MTTIKLLIRQFDIEKKNKITPIKTFNQLSSSFYIIINNRFFFDNRQYQKHNRWLIGDIRSKKNKNKWTDNNWINNCRLPQWFAIGFNSIYIDDDQQPKHRNQVFSLPKISWLLLCIKKTTTTTTITNTKTEKIPHFWPLYNIIIIYAHQCYIWAFLFNH